jgi:excisionase family DNA binding protein
MSPTAVASIALRYGMATKTDPLKADLIAGDIPEVSSPNELAHHLGVSRRFLEEQVKAGRLRVRRISPRAVRFFRGDVLAWLNSVSSPPSPQSRAEAHPSNRLHCPSFSAISAGASITQP